jgi:hypothetical protein
MNKELPFYTIAKDANPYDEDAEIESFSFADCYNWSIKYQDQLGFEPNLLFLSKIQLSTTQLVLKLGNVEKTIRCKRGDKYVFVWNNGLLICPITSKPKDKDKIFKYVCQFNYKPRSN